jgi:hypothetical protein
MILAKQLRICDVCRLVDYDTTEKICGYCPLCDAWICDADATDWVRRIKAAVLRKLEPGYRGDPNYGEKQGESNARA